MRVLMLPWLSATPREARPYPTSESPSRAAACRRTAMSLREVLAWVAVGLIVLFFAALIYLLVLVLAWDGT
jgi:hypothetical protein